MNLVRLRESERHMITVIWSLRQMAADDEERQMAADDEEPHLADTLNNLADVESAKLAAVQWALKRAFKRERTPCKNRDCRGGTVYFLDATPYPCRECVA